MLAATRLCSNHFHTHAHSGPFNTHPDVEIDMQYPTFCAQRVEPTVEYVMCRFLGQIEKAQAEGDAHIARIMIDQMAAYQNQRVRPLHNILQCLPNFCVNCSPCSH